VALPFAFVAVVLVVEPVAAVEPAQVVPVPVAPALVAPVAVLAGPAAW